MIHNRSSFVNRTLFQTKMGKVYTRFQTKTAQKLYPLGPHMYLYVLYKGVPSPPPEGFEHGVVLLETFTEFEEKGGRKAQGPLIIYRLWGGGGGGGILG